jgi:nucleoside-diphosphate-sugar epimerase
MSAPICVVLGGHGFVGSAIVRAAQARRYMVHAVGRSEYAEWVGKSCDLLINANGNSRKWMANQDPLADFRASVESVVRSCLDFKAQRLVFCSSIDVYPTDQPKDGKQEDTVIHPGGLSRYGFHKWTAEQVVRHYRPDALIVRMGGFVGPGLWKNSVYDLLTGAPLRVHPDSAYQFMSTDDFANILLSLLDGSPPPAGTINMCGEGLITVRDIAMHIPGADLPRDTSMLPKEHYEIPIERARGLVTPWPRTQETVHAFIEGVRAGRIPLGKEAPTK